MANLGYGLELELKDEALRLFWHCHELPGRPQSVVRSPLPRHYRTTSKRRVFFSAGTASKVMNRARRNPANGIFFASEGAEILEPAGHAHIFAALEERLQSPPFAPLARSLNFVIIRGTYEEFMVILNLHTLDRDVHRLALRAANALHELKINVISAFLTVDPSRSPYYLETDVLRGSFSLKRLFGPDRFRLRVEGRSFAVPPTSFSQVNESLLPILVGEAQRLLESGNGGRLLDLYCGYGLFAFTLGSAYREVIAVDAAGVSVRAGSEMAARIAGRTRRRFIAGAIERSSLERLLPPPGLPGEEDVVLDPPRRGADSQVIASIARRRPGRVLHLFCAAEDIPAAVNNWRRSGYFVRRAVPLDMFAGTPQLEVMILLTRA